MLLNYLCIEHICQAKIAGTTVLQSKFLIIHIIAVGNKMILLKKFIPSQLKFLVFEYILVACFLPCGTIYSKID